MAQPSPAVQNPYPQTGSGLTDNTTRTSLSTMIVVKVGDLTVGAIQSISVNEQRSIEMIDELGTDGHIDSCPNKSTEISGDCKVVRFNRKRATEAFGRGFLHAKSQRVPFDIEIIDIMDGDTVDKAIVTTIKNVWIEKVSYSYSSDNWVIVDDISWKAEDICSKVGGKPAARGGLNNQQVYYDAYELAADVGNRKGSMDAPGLYNAVLTLG